MQFYLDTANLEEIKKYSKLGIVDGVTTNPSLIAKEGVALESRIKEICQIVAGPVSSEVVATDYEGMITEGRSFAKWANNVYVKLPMTMDGIRACKTLSDEGIRVNMTLIFSTAQALLAAKAGAALISPFVGRLDDIGEDGMSLIADIVTMLGNYDYQAKVLVASVRHPRHVIDASMIGADICTMPTAVLEKLFQHPLTDKGLAAFLADWEKVKNIQAQ
jgi:transaldolase